MGGTVTTIGLIVNPIAGLGGRVGLKGTDGLADQALALGGVPMAGQKAGRALEILANSGAEFRLLVPPGEMGEAVSPARQLGAETLGPACPPTTTARDTIAAARAMAQSGADLILFAGGDGTARDLCRALGETLPVIGIPAGVKIHSPVFATTPETAGALAAEFARGRIKRFTPGEVLDIDEEAYRQGRVRTRLYGTLLTPQDPGAMQNRKAGTPVSEAATQNLIALDIIDSMTPDTLYLIGPGTTTRPVMENMGLPHTLLGVDLVLDKKLIQGDAAEDDIQFHMAERPARIIVTPIGGQGYIFGRGNHQLSPTVIKQIGKENIIVAATLEKIGSLKGRPLLVDTGDPETDVLLKGYIRVTTGYRQEMICKVD